MINTRVESMAYSGKVPWGESGKRVPPDLTPKQMLRAAGLNWTVEKLPLSYTRDGRKHDSDMCALVRRSTDPEKDGTHFSNVPTKWNEVQNEQAFEFFLEFVESGGMEMHTAGSLQNGEIVWALAKINNSFDLFRGKDQVDSYMLLANPHVYGKSIIGMFTPIRVECWNSFSLALSHGQKAAVQLNHRRQFEPEYVKMMLAKVDKRMDLLRQQATLLTKVRYDKDDLINYLNEVLPQVATATRKLESGELSKPAKEAFDVMNTQPGAHLGAGTWWQAFNAVTYTIDHVTGVSESTRLNSAWFGKGQRTKETALELALKFAK